MDEKTKASEQAALASYLRGLARGLGPDLLGGPVDLARDALNLGIAGVGYAGHKAGLLKEPLPLIEPGAVGDSDWWAKLTNVSDDGTGQYTAGRLTPLGVSAAGAAGQGAKRLVNAMASRPAPSRSGPPATLKAQEGALYPGGRKDLIASHSTTTEGLSGALGTGKTVELHSPSFAVTNRYIPASFSRSDDSIQLIPREGAFDPATYSSTLLNRDAYTPRWSQMRSKVVGQATSQPPLPVLEVKYGGNFKDFLRDAYNGDLHYLDLLDGNTGERMSRAEFEKVYKLGTLSVIDPNYIKALGNYSSGLDTDAARSYRFGSRSETWERDLKLFEDVWNNSERWQLPGRALNPREEAQKRLVDRLYTPAQGKSVAGMESGATFSNSQKIGSPEFTGDVTGRLSQDLAIKGSPVFRSFSQYEKHPLGAKLLTSRGQLPDYDEYEANAIQEAMTANLGRHEGMGLEVPDVKKVLAQAIKFRQQGLKGPELIEALRGTDLLRGNYSSLGSGYLRERVHSIPVMAEDVQKAYVRSPANYAELKVHGTVPVTGETFAGAILRSKVRTHQQERALKALERAGVPVRDMNPINEMSFGELQRQGHLPPDSNWGDIEDLWFKAAMEIQQQAGPARKRRMFEK